MDPLVVCLALGPVAAYLLMLGMTNLSRRPRMVTGVRDVAVLSLAISGLVLLGPLELLLPFAAVVSFGPYVWLLLVALYVMSVVLALLVLRPRLVIYNISVDQLRPVLADAVERVEPNARWAGDCLSLPDLKIQLYVDTFAALRSVSLVSAGGNQSRSGWRRLEMALSAALAREEVPRSPRGLLMLAGGLLCCLAIGLVIWQYPRELEGSLLDAYQMLCEMFGL